jgi:cyclopropane fatty-acyl-phospholipid synthase-like methyltransferase
MKKEKGWQKIFKKGGINVKEPHKDMSKIVKILKKEKAKKILDLGCGSGRHVIYLASKGFDVYGTDSASEGINLCRKWLKQLNLKANLKVSSFFEKFPFKDNFFDAIVSIWAIHHGKEKQIKYCIEEIERTLRPKGLILIVVTSTFKGRPVEEKKKIEEHTWMITKGLEKGVPHHIFSKQMVKSYFKNFEILGLHKDKYEHWCLLGKLKEKAKRE